MDHITIWPDAYGCRAAGYVALSRVRNDEDYLLAGTLTPSKFVPVECWPEPTSSHRGAMGVTAPSQHPLREHTQRGLARRAVQEQRSPGELGTNMFPNNEFFNKEHLFLLLELVERARIARVSL